MYTRPAAGNYHAFPTTICDSLYLNTKTSPYLQEACTQSQDSNSLRTLTLTCGSVVAGIKCPVCSKFVLPDDIECHLVMCLTRPRLSYNGT